MKLNQHWDNVYSTKSSTEVSWFQEHAELSLKLIKNSGVRPLASVIDVGGGASTLVDDLLSNHYENITVLDLSNSALHSAKSRLRDSASKVTWIESDILESHLPINAFDVWHDRAVFHFLTDEHDRQKYVRKVIRSVKPGGFVIVATFAEDGPTQCSGLPVMRYSADELHAAFGQSFDMIDHAKESHFTPDGAKQQFVYCFCKVVV